MQRSAKKSLIIGIYHDVFAKRHRKPFLDGTRAVSQQIQGLPPHSRVGLEISPEELELAKVNQGIETEFTKIAQHAIKQGHTVVPLLPSRLNKKYSVVLGKIVEEFKNPQTPAGAQKIQKLFELENTYRLLTSIKLGKNHLNKECDLSIIGTFHARDLEPHMRDQAQFRLFDASFVSRVRHEETPYWPFSNSAKFKKNHELIKKHLMKK
jgi:hypothetical protein